MKDFREFRAVLVRVLALVLAAATFPAYAATFTVITTIDSGAGSLRDAISAANATAAADTIDFASGLTGTIDLASALPVLSSNVTIQGPGADEMTVSGGGATRVFAVSGGTTVEIAGLTIAGGSAVNGAGISNEGTLTLRDCVMRDNSASGNGGAVDNFGGVLEIVGCEITGNEADAGGGVASDTTLTVIDALFSNNVSVLGGGIDNIGNALVRRSTISGNAADFGGGLGNTGQLVVVNSTISGNSASDSGGGIENFGGDFDLEFTTVARNSAASGSGVWNDNLFDAKNSLVVDSTGSDCDNAGGQFMIEGVNHDTDGTCPGFTPSSSTAVALGPLADNGGPTRTHALEASSVAIDAAPDCTRLDGATSITQDQRGSPRPEGTACDLGAFEAAFSDLVYANGFE
ncbi:MAG: choice-of-anchor Q domain-containing protein [Candidatus Wenzhouxiangella sp. M2_3B_020]